VKMDFHKKELPIPDQVETSQKSNDPHTSKSILPIKTCTCPTLPKYQHPFVTPSTRLNPKEDQSQVVQSRYIPDYSAYNSQFFPPNLLTSALNASLMLSSNDCNIKSSSDHPEKTNELAPDQEQCLLRWYNRLQLYKEKFLHDWNPVFRMRNGNLAEHLVTDHIEKTNEFFRSTEHALNMSISQQNATQLDSLLYSVQNFAGKPSKLPSSLTSRESLTTGVSQQDWPHLYSKQRNGSYHNELVKRSKHSATTSNYFTYQSSTSSNNNSSSNPSSSNLSSEFCNNYNTFHANPDSPTLSNLKAIESLQSDRSVFSLVHPSNSNFNNFSSSEKNTFKHAKKIGSAQSEASFSDSLKCRKSSSLLVKSGLNQSLWSDSHLNKNETYQSDKNYCSSGSSHYTDDTEGSLSTPLNLSIRRSEPLTQHLVTSPTMITSNFPEKSIHLYNSEKSRSQVSIKSSPSRKISLERSKSNMNSSDKFTPPKRYKRYSKPPFSYVALIVLAIASSKNKRLQLSQILARIAEMFPFFRGQYQGWRDSIRHNLSQFECFIKTLKNPFKPHSKGNYWSVDIQAIPHELLLCQNTQVSRGAGHRYCKDISKVFNLETGLILTFVPSSLLTENGNLIQDPSLVIDKLLREQNLFDNTSDKKTTFHLHQVFSAETTTAIDALSQNEIAKLQIVRANSENASTSSNNNKRKISSESRNESIFYENGNDNKQKEKYCRVSEKRSRLSES